MDQVRGEWRLRQTKTTYHIIKAHLLPEDSTMSICKHLSYALLGEVTSNKEVYCKDCLKALKRKLRWAN